MERRKNSEVSCTDARSAGSADTLSGDEGGVLVMNPSGERAERAESTWKLTRHTRSHLKHSSPLITWLLQQAIVIISIAVQTLK